MASWGSRWLRLISSNPGCLQNFGKLQILEQSRLRTQPTLGYIGGQFYSSDATKAPALEREILDKMVKRNKVVVFMKGIPDEPRCGFSNAVVQILRMHGVEKYDAHDVLKDEGVRQGIKDYTNWPTIPQVFINGDFVGGCDIMIQMHQNGDLVKELEKAGIKSALSSASDSESGKK